MVTMVEMTSAEMTDEEDASLEIRVLGDFAVLRNGENVRLPPSRKTRALLAYLAVTNHPQHRDRLCTMFWDVPDDPRGALRWSLSKIRQIVNTNGQDALVTDGHMVTLRSGSIALDLRRIKTISLGDLASQDISELEDIVRLFRGEFLDDLSLPRCPKFESWRISWLDEVNLFKARLLRTLIDRLHGDASRALPYAHALHALHPQDSAIAAAKEALAERAREEAIKAPNFKPLEESLDAPPVKTSEVGPKPTGSAPMDIRFCTARDGARIAYSVMGEGPPIVKTATLISHLQFDWESPI